MKAITLRCTSINLPLSSCSSPPSLSARLVTPVSQRHQSSSRRTTKRLRVKPDPSLTSGIPPENINDHIVFNPPSSTPSVFHTPAAFLPPNDPRRQIFAQSHSFANPYDRPDRRLPPPIRAPYEKKYHLSAGDIEQIRRLRTEDPFTWTRTKLAEKFNCSQFFVGMVSEISKEVKEQQKQTMENDQRNWSLRKQTQRKDREKRRTYWGRDE